MILPPRWVEVMGRVRSVLPSAVLAGGALRDLDNNRPVKDFDVFFTDQYDADKLSQVLGSSYAYHNQCIGEYIDAAKEVQRTYTFISTEEGLPDLNFIQLDPNFNPADIVTRVDFGICEVSYDLLGVVKTCRYKKDQQDQTFTLTRAESLEGVLRSLKRYERLAQKYQGWKLVVPTEHMGVFQAAAALKARGFEATVFTPDPDGIA